MKIIFLILVLINISACTWVELNASGKQVQIKELVSDAENCQRVGTVNATTRSYLIADADRDAEKIANELSILARNEAATIYANTIVPSRKPEKGQQFFTAYRCP